MFGRMLRPRAEPTLPMEHQGPHASGYALVPMSAAADDQKRGLLLVFTSTLAYGAMPIFAKTTYEAGLASVTLLAWRFVLATVLFALLPGRAPKRLGWADHARLW